MSGNRVVLCIPRGGLNDVLCQMERCWAYAETWQRQLYVDDRESALQGLLWTLFEVQPPCASPAPPVVTTDLQHVLRLARSGTIRPPEVPVADALAAGRFNDLVRYSAGHFVLKSNGVRTSFDFGRDHPEDLLVHFDCGGGSCAQKLLGRIRLRSTARDQILDRLGHLPEDYVSLHVRHTDMTSDFKGLLKRTRGRLEGRNVLICSDSHAVVEYATAYLSASTVFTTDAVRSRDGAALHRSMIWGKEASEAERQRFVLDTLTDLVALARGQEIHVAPNFPPMGGPPARRMMRRAQRALGLKKPSVQSGYSKLAQYLCGNRDVRDRFLGLQ